MKALTLRHPWAFAIAFLGKDIENRDWSEQVAEIMGLHAVIERGDTVAIHGGAAPQRPKRKARSLDNPWLAYLRDLNALRSLMDGQWPDEALAYLAQRAGGRPVQPEDFIMPGIVATCEIVGSTWASRSRWAAAGDLHLMLADVVRIEPVQVPGSRGFWDVPDVIEAEVRRRADEVRAGRRSTAQEKTAAEWLGL